MSTECGSIQENDYDIIVLGGGLNGLAAALALSESDLSIALVENSDLTQKQTPPSRYDSRVCALTEASYCFLDNLAVWNEVDCSRVCEFDRVEAWDAEGIGRIVFHAREAGHLQLGRIAENSVMLSGMLKRLAASQVKCFDNTEVTGLEKTSSRISLLLADNKVITAKLLIAADGAHSKVRQWSFIPQIRRDCLHHAIICTVKTRTSHQHCAWQVFLESGPLAFLPLPAVKEDNGQKAHYHSVVWSLKPEKAREVMAMDDNCFCEALSHAGEACVGVVEQASSRTCIPLSQQHALTYVKDRVVLVGDAAHTVHPLAGQGVNLGFLDVAVLAEEILKAHHQENDPGNPQILQRYWRRRQKYNFIMQGAMEFFQHIYNQNALP
ncbi:MAG: FAD-dependent monooxygenase, partial [Endozoicomonadaceae bacterium]|nr:FAD-dependent monooxygenase [Endozoicomonadaceae bacterium]